MTVSLLLQRLTVPKVRITEQHVEELLGKLDLREDDQRRVAQDYLLSRGETAQAWSLDRHAFLFWHFRAYLLQIAPFVTTTQHYAVQAVLHGRRPWSSLTHLLRKLTLALVRANGHHAALVTITNPRTRRKITALAVDGQPIKPARSKDAWKDEMADVGEWKRRQRAKLAEGMQTRRASAET